MTDDKNEKPGSEQTMPLSKRLRLPDNCRDVTAERTGTVIAVVGAEHLTPNRPTSKLFERWGLPDNCTDATAEGIGKIAGVFSPAKARLRRGERLQGSMRFL